MLGMLASQFIGGNRKCWDSRWWLVWLERPGVNACDVDTIILWDQSTIKHSDGLDNESEDEGQGTYGPSGFSAYHRKCFSWLRT